MENNEINENLIDNINIKLEKNNGAEEKPEQIKDEQQNNQIEIKKENKITSENINKLYEINLQKEYEDKIFQITLEKDNLVQKNNELNEEKIKLYS